MTDIREAAKSYPTWARAQEYHNWYCKQQRGTKEERTNARLIKKEAKKVIARSIIQRDGRTCGRCEIHKNYLDFGVDNSPRNLSGRSWICKSCGAKLAKERRDRDLMLSREKERIKVARYTKLNPDKVKQARRKRHINRTPEQKITHRLRCRFYAIMKGVVRTPTKNFASLCGCTREYLKIHLELRFTKNMTWENYGNYWHIDHIIPVSKFDHFDKRQVRQCWHFTNLEPLEAKANISKSNKITRPQMSLTL